MATSMDSSSSEKVDIATKKIQQGFVVISWNVLHMIHEINYVYDMSPVINRYSIKEKWSNEKLRLNDIAKTLSELLIKNSTIECFICLQEVPGDLLPILREVLDSHVGSTLTSKPLIHTHVYSRKPQVRGRQVDSLYTDPNESLATVHYNPSGMLNEKAAVSEIGEKHLLSDDQISWTPCPTDAGKGALTVTTTSGLSVVNVHVPFNDEPATLLLSNISWPENNNSFVFVGDMNCPSKTLMSRIGEITNGKPSSGLLFPVTTDKPTRVGLRQDGVLQKSWIDHYVVSASLKDLTMPPVVVYDDIGDISDHYPILLQFKGT
jgi:endonuclease/exonuclease/phosphatase family metal-dependent hydrolase